MLEAYFLVWCYTNTIASCQTIAGLPNAQECASIFAKVKVGRATARIEKCEKYNVVSGSVSGNYLTAN